MYFIFMFIYLSFWGGFVLISIVFGLDYVPPLSSPFILFLSIEMAGLVLVCTSSVFPVNLRVPDILCLHSICILRTLLRAQWRVGPYGSWLTHSPTWAYFPDLAGRFRAAYLSVLRCCPDQSVLILTSSPSPWPVQWTLVPINGPCLFRFSGL